MTKEDIDVPVPAAKQLLQGSSSPLNLSHLLLVFRHWSQAEEGDIWDVCLIGVVTRSVKWDTYLCYSFSYWKRHQLCVGHHRISQGREGRALWTWRTVNEKRREKDGASGRPSLLINSVIAPEPRYGAEPRPARQLHHFRFSSDFPSPSNVCTIHHSYLPIRKGKLIGHMHMPPAPSTLTITTGPL